MEVFECISDDEIDEDRPCTMPMSSTSRHSSVSPIRFASSDLGGPTNMNDSDDPYGASNKKNSFLHAQIRRGDESSSCILTPLKASTDESGITEKYSKKVSKNC